MKRLMVDMDEVICSGGFFKHIKEFLNIDVDINDIDDYYLQHLLGSREEEFWIRNQDTNFYQDVPLLPNCYEVLEKLSKYFDIYIVTSFIWGGTPDLSSNNLKFKYEYLKEKLPFIPTSKYIFSSNKNIMDFDIKIDDRLVNLGNAETKIMVDQWHNRKHSDIEMEGIYRVSGWLEIYDLLKNIYNLEDL